jgi:hypothetical protein
MLCLVVTKALLATVKVVLVTTKASFVAIEVCWDVAIKGCLPCVDMYLLCFVA